MLKTIAAYLMLIIATAPAVGDDKKNEGKIDPADLPLLAKDKKVFIEKADKDADVAMSRELLKWGRWKVVADESEADLLVRLRVSGSAVWGVAHVQASILDAKTKKTLWTSKDHKGTRTIFHGYASPFSRAIEGIAKQLKKEIKD